MDTPKADAPVLEPWQHSDAIHATDLFAPDSTMEDLYSQSGAPSGLGANAGHEGLDHFGSPSHQQHGGLPSFVSTSSNTAGGQNSHDHFGSPWGGNEAGPAFASQAYREPHPGSMSTASSTSFLTDNGWDDQDLLFTPLLSPAMTSATSAFSPAVSASTYKPTQPSSIDGHLSSQTAAQDPFSPLTSPALRPQGRESYQPPQQQLQQHQQAGDSSAPASQQHPLTALVGTMDPQALANLQAQAAGAFLQGQKQILSSLGLGHLLHSPEALALLMQQQQQQQQHQPAQSSQATMPGLFGNAPSPDQQLPPPQSSRDAAQRSSRGRGASRTAPKTRPSPIMRPMTGSSAPSPQQQQQPPSRSRKQSTAGGASSHSSSTDASPRFPASVFSSTGAQPLSHLTLDESPSPIDLSSMLGSQKSRSASSSPPEHDAKHNHGAHHHHHQGSASSVMNGAEYAPITPSTLMNLPDELSILHGLSPALNPVPEHPAHQPPATTSVSTDVLVGRADTEMPPPPLLTGNASHNGEASSSKAASHANDKEAMPAPAPPKAPARKTSTRKPAGSNAPATAAPPQSSVSARARGKSKAKAPIDFEDPADRRASHKNAEQRRRDSLKECFEELRHLLPHIPPEEDEEAPRRPGEGNIGGQRSTMYDPDHPNKGVSKVALLRKSNEYLQKLHGRIERRDAAINALREKLGSVGLTLDERDEEALDGFTLDSMDVAELGAWPYPRTESDEMLVEQQQQYQQATAPKRSSSRRSGGYPNGQEFEALS